METLGKILGALVAIAWILAFVASGVLWFGPIEDGREFLGSGWGLVLLVFGVGPVAVGIVGFGTALVVSLIEDEGWKATLVMMAILVGAGLLLWGYSNATLEKQGWVSTLSWLAGRVSLVLGGFLVVCFPLGAVIALVRNGSGRPSSATRR